MSLALKQMFIRRKPG